MPDHDVHRQPGDRRRKLRRLVEIDQEFDVPAERRDRVRQRPHHVDGTTFRSPLWSTRLKRTPRMPASSSARTSSAAMSGSTTATPRSPAAAATTHRAARGCRCRRRSAAPAPRGRSRARRAGAGSLRASNPAACRCARPHRESASAGPQMWAWVSQAPGGIRVRGARGFRSGAGQGRSVAGIAASTLNVQCIDAGP